jgi:hypothetical protein
VRAGALLATLLFSAVALGTGNGPAHCRPSEHPATDCEDQRALPHLALTHAELAIAYGLGSRVGQEHAETAARLAQQLGMQPLGTELSAQLTASRRSEPTLTAAMLPLRSASPELTSHRDS